jgi:hypothetical protein
MPRWLETIFMVVIMALVVCMLFMALLQTSGCSEAPAVFKLEDLDTNTAELEDLDTNTAELEDLGTGTAELEDLDTGTAELEDLGTGTAELEDLGTDTAELEDLGTGTAELEDLGTDTGSDELPDSGADPCELRIADLGVCGECFHCDRCRDGSGTCERDGLGQLASLPDCNDKPIFCPLSKRDLRDGCSCVLCCGEE